MWKFFCEWKLAQHVIETNVCKNVPAAAHKLKQQFLKFLCPSDVEVPEEMTSAAKDWWQQKSENAQSIWLHRWRQRWGFLHGHLNPHSFMPENELQEKAKIIQNQFQKQFQN